MSCQSRESLVTILDTFRQTRRPRLLLRTARIGLAEYVRDRDLRRVMRLPAAPPPGPATVRALLEMEAEQEAQRTRAPLEIGDTWRAARHVEVLIALMAETRLMAQAVSLPADIAAVLGTPAPDPATPGTAPPLGPSPLTQPGPPGLRLVRRG
jgi:hypothetical protein